MTTAPPSSPRFSGPLPHFFQVLNLEHDEHARALVMIFTEQIALAEEIVKCREALTEAEEALAKVEQGRKEFAQERKRDEKRLDEKTRQALKKEKKNAERAARKRGFPIAGGLTVTSTNVLTFMEAQASLASVAGPKDICRVVDVIKEEGTLVSDTGRHFHTGPIRNETTFQLLCGLAFREVAEAREKVAALEQRAKELDQQAEKGHQGLMDSVRRRYKVLAVRMHPDKLQRPPTEEDYQRFRELQTAHQVLSDTDLRRRYIQMMDHNAFLATLPKVSKDADQEGHRPVIKRDKDGVQPTRTVLPNDHRRLTGGFPHQCTRPRIIDSIVTDPKRGHTRVMLTWNCASAEELQISRYEVQVKQRSTGPEASEWIRIYMGWSTEWWTDVLPPGHYSFRVRAENNLGLGEWSTFLDYYIEDIQAVRQQRREELERNKEERRSKLAKRLRWQISVVLNQTGNVPTTEKLSKLRTLLDQARRSKMDEVVEETEEIVMGLEARVAKNEEQHLWRSKLHEYVKAVLKEGGDGRVDKDSDGQQMVEQDAEDEGAEDPDTDEAEDDGKGTSSSGAGVSADSSVRPPSPTKEGHRATLSDFEEFLVSLPDMYPPDTPYTLPATIRNQIVQTVQALIRNRPPLRVTSIVPQKNNPSDISLSVSCLDIYQRILAIARAALTHKEYLGGQAGFKGIHTALGVLAREIDDANRSMDKKRQQIESFLKERERSMKARAESDCVGEPLRGHGALQARTETQDDTGTAAAAQQNTHEYDKPISEANIKTFRVDVGHHEHIDEPPPPYTPREVGVRPQTEEDNGGWNDASDPSNNDRENPENSTTPRLRRRGTRGGVRRRKNSETQGQAQASVVSPRQSRRGSRARVRPRSLVNGVAVAAESAEYYEDAKKGSGPVSLLENAVETNADDTSTTTKCLHRPSVPQVQFNDIELESHHNKSTGTSEPAEIPMEKTSEVSPMVDIGDDPKLFGFLASLNLEQYLPAFLAHDASWSLLPLLRESDLVQLGITKVGPRKRIMHFIDDAKKREEVQLPDTTATTVAEWLENLGLSVYAEGFFREEVAFEDLPALAEDDLVNTFEMHKIGHLRKAMASIEGLKTRNKKIPVVPVNEGAPVEDLKSKPLTNVLDANADSTASAAQTVETGIGFESLDTSCNENARDEQKSSHETDVQETLGQPERQQGVPQKLPASHVPFPQQGLPQMLNGGHPPGPYAQAVKESSIDNSLVPQVNDVHSYTHDQLGSRPASLPVSFPDHASGPGTVGLAWGDPNQSTTHPANNSSRMWPQSRASFDAAFGANYESFVMPSGPTYGTYPGRTDSRRATYEREAPLSNGYGLHGANVYRQQISSFPPQRHQQPHGVNPIKFGGGVGGGSSVMSSGTRGAGYNTSTVGGRVPPEFVCALTRRIMNVPVQGPDGYYYDHAQLRARLIAENTWRSPITMMYYPVEAWHRCLHTPDMHLKGLIDTFIATGARRRSSVGALNAARDLWESGSDTQQSRHGFDSVGGTPTVIPSAPVSVPSSVGGTSAPVSGLKATMGLNGWTADVPGGASIWR